MSLELRHKRLIVLLVILLMIRFVIQPFWDWQQAYQNTIVTNQNLYLKVRRLVESNVSQSDFDNALEKGKANVVEVFPLSQNDNFSLGFQQQLSDLSAKYQMKLDLFDWLSESPLAGNHFKSAVVQVRVTGSNTAAVNFQADLEQLDYVKVHAVSLNWFQDMGSSAEVTMQLELTVGFNNSEEVHAP